MTQDFLKQPITKKVFLYALFLGVIVGVIFAKNNTNALSIFQTVLMFIELPVIVYGLYTIRETFLKSRSIPEIQIGIFDDIQTKIGKETGFHEEITQTKDKVLLLFCII
ncbi:MAG: hypothetical protein MUF38_09540 [Anaerolineae bacterium]|nr:hypothetical protein [Anaerolineae bacterium]